MDLIENNIKQILYSKEQIDARITELGRMISEDYKDDPPVVIGVIKGALYFFSDLTRAIDLPIDIDMIDYEGVVSGDPALTLPHPRARARSAARRRCPRRSAS